jgi:hypothetical protein
MENRAFGTLLALLLLCCLDAAHAASEPLRILYAEPFLAQSTSARGVQKPGATPLRVSAFGRTFELELEDNARLLRATSAQTRERIGAIQLFKGTIKDVPNSWVRLTLSDGLYSGVFWDGAELYAVAPRETLQTALLVPMQPATNAIFRLSDTQGGLLEGICGVAATERVRSNPLEKFKALIHELRAAADSAFAAAPREIEVAMIADFELTNRLGAGTTRHLLDKANIVDGIFSSQLGVSTIPTDFVTFATDTDPFTASEASSLLEQLGAYRSVTPAIRSRGLAHLMTGRQLAGNILGVGYLGSLCEVQAGSSLSEDAGLLFDSALIMAHELGHNFGAPHDNETGSPCEAEPLGRLMAPEYNNSTTFSACSVQHMQAQIAAASCVVTSRNRDVAVSVPTTPLQTIVNEPIDVPVDLLSLGDTDAVNVVLTMGIPGNLTLSSATMPGAECTIESQSFRTLRCVMPSLAAGATARLTMRVIYNVPGNVNLVINVLSSNDVNSGNDRGTVSIAVVDQSALQVTTVSVPATVTRGDPFDVEFDVAAVGNQALSNVTVEFFILFLGRAVTASIDGGSCETRSSAQLLVLCTIGSVVPGAPRRLRARVIADSVHTDSGAVQAYAQGAFASVGFALHTQPAHDIEVWTDQDDRIVAVDTDAVWPLELRSRGAYPMDDVHVQISLWTGADASLTGSLAALCTRISSDAVDCDLGTMDPGEVVAGTLRARADEPTSLSFMVQLMQQDDDFMNNSRGLDLRVGVASDASVSAPATLSVFEQRPATLQATVSALGTGASENLIVRATLPAQFSISSARLAQSSCELISQNSVRCRHAALAPGASIPLTVDYQAGAPGVFLGSIDVLSSQDLISSNDGRTVTFEVAPDVNSSLAAPAPGVFPAGVATEIVYTLRTNKYALPDARLDFSWFGTLDQFVATAPGANCAATANGHRCNFSTIVANSSIPVRVRIRSPGATVASINAVLASTAETSAQDNAAFVSYTFLERGDLTLSTTQPAPSAITGQRAQVLFNLDVLSTVLDGYLEIGFDPARVEAPATLIGSPCTWNTQPVRCQLGSTRSAGSYVENFSFVPRGTGSLQLTLRVGGRNDFNTANDQLAITVNVSNPPPPPPPPPPSSGGGGGGGSMSWLLSALLLAMWHHRRLRDHRRHLTFT